MRISREELRREAEATGFRAEVLEKVIRLLSLLERFTSHPFLKGRLALKGGTALNVKDIRSRGFPATTLGESGVSDTRARSGREEAWRSI